MSTVARWGAPGGALQGIKLADVVHPMPFDGLCKLSGRVVAVHRWLNGPAKFENSEAGHLCDGTSDCRPLMEVQAAGVPKQDATKTQDKFGFDEATPFPKLPVHPLAVTRRKNHKCCSSANLEDGCRPDDIILLLHGACLCDDIYSSLSSKTRNEKATGKSK